MNFENAIENLFFAKYNLSLKYDLAMWDITHKCNLNCLHCYNGEKINQISSKNLNMEQKKFITDKLIELGFKEINLGGGEPFIDSDIISLIRYIFPQKTVLSINTNGLLVNKNIVDILAEIGFSNIAFSMAGTSSKTNDKVRGIGAFDNVVKNISYMTRKFDDKGIHNNSSINFSMTSNNLDELIYLYPFCKKLGIKFASVHFTQPIGSALKNIEIIEKNQRKIFSALCALVENWGNEVSLTIDSRPLLSNYISLSKQGVLSNRSISYCLGGVRNIYITPDGEIFPCKLMTLKKGNHKLLTSQENNIFQFMEFRSNYIKKNNCMNCYFSSICSPCPLISENNLPRECTITQKMFKKEVERIQKFKYIFSDNIYEEDTENKFRIKYEGKQYVLSNDGHLIWNVLKNKQTLFDVMDCLYQNQKIKCNFENIYKFIFDLYLMGVINFSEKNIKENRSVYYKLICCGR